VNWLVSELFSDLVGDLNIVTRGALVNRELENCKVTTFERSPR
jgi:hypothetical protein